MIDDVCFVPDSQIVFPAVFLTKVTKLRYPCCMYKDCFDVLKRQYNYIVLPSNQTDFSNLILRKLQRFLETIESEIRSAREKRLTESEFYIRTRSRLQSINTFGKHFGDLMLFWNINRELFWSFVLLDWALTRKKMTELALEKMAEFSRICEGHSIGFSEEEQKLTEGLYVLIKDSKNKHTIKHHANDEDLLILADCFIYKDKRFLQGVMYLITDDKELHGTTTEIIEHPNLVFPDLKTTDRYVGFEPLKPEKFITDFKKPKTS